MLRSATLVVFVFVVGCSASRVERPAQSADAPEAQGGARSALRIESIERVDGEERARRPRVEPVAFSIADIPRAVLPRPFSSSLAPSAGEPRRTMIADASGEKQPAPELVRFRFETSAPDARAIWTGWSDDAIDGDYGGQHLACTTAGARVLPARWESIGAN